MSFFCYLHGGPQTLEELCRHRILRQQLRCRDGATGNSDSIDINAEAVSGIR